MLGDLGKLVPPAVDTLPINLAILDDTGEILLTNQAWQDFGRENDVAVRPDMWGVNYLEVTEQADDETAHAVAEGLREMIAGNQDLVEVEYPCHSPAEQRWFLMRAAPFTVEDTRYLAVAHIDITDRVQAERAAKRFQLAVETAGHAVFLTDPDGTITYVNPAFEKITGYSSDEAVGQTPRILKSDETPDEVYQDLWTTITAGNVWEGILLNRRKSGQLYYAQQSIAPVLDSESELVEFLAIQTDVTTLQESEIQLEKLSNILRHDVRNQLNIIQGHADLLSESGNPAATHAAAIAQATERLLSVTEKARQMTAFLASEDALSPRDIIQIVTSAANTEQAAHPDATITVEGPDEAVALSVGNFEMAVTELLRNGLIYNEAESPQVAITITEETEWVEIRVTDNGVGIPAVEYETLDSGEVSQIHHDTGVGLNLVYWIVRRSGGQLHFEENYPNGSVALIKLPRPDSSP